MRREVGEGPRARLRGLLARDRRPRAHRQHQERPDALRQLHRRLQRPQPGLPVQVRNHLPGRHRAGGLRRSQRRLPLGRRHRPRIGSVRRAIQSLDRQRDLAHLPDQRQRLRSVARPRQPGDHQGRHPRGGRRPYLLEAEPRRRSAPRIAGTADRRHACGRPQLRRDGRRAGQPGHPADQVPDSTGRMSDADQQRDGLLHRRIRQRPEEQFRRRRSDHPEELGLDPDRPERHRAYGRGQAQRQDLHLRERRQEPGPGDLGPGHREAHPGHFLGAEGDPAGTDRRRLAGGHGQLGDRRQQRQPLEGNASVHLRRQPGQPRRRAQRLPLGQVLPGQVGRHDQRDAGGAGRSTPKRA